MTLLGVRITLRTPRRRHALATASLLILIAALTLAGAAQAASVKLNPTPPGGGSRVQAFALTPDASRVIYRADLEHVGAFEIYNAAIGGGDNFKISGALVDGGSVSTIGTQLAISKNGARVVYIADADTNGVDELYSVTVGGTDRVKLNLPLGPGQNVSSFAISADSSRVVYIADQQTAGVKEIYSAPIAGGETPIKLNNAIVPGGGVLGLVLSPDGSRAIYLAEQDTDGVPELYSASIFNGGSVKLHVPLAAPSRVVTFQVPAAGSRVVFTVAPNDMPNTPVVLYGAPVDGSALATQIASDVVPAGTLLFAATFVLSPDGSHVVYTAKAVGGVVWLFCSPTTGGTPARLNDDPRTIGRVNFTLATFSPDSTRVVYPAGDQLWAVSVNGGAVTSLSGPMVAGGSINLGLTFAVTPDNQRVVYLADQQTFGVTELFSVPLAGGEVVKLNRALAEDGDVSSFVVSPNSGRVVYRAEQDTKNTNELYAVPVAGGAIVKLNSAVVAGGGVTSTFRVSADSQRVVYLARQDSATVQELYSAPLFGPPTTLAAAVLPTSRSVQVGSPATVFATIVNAGPSAGEACTIAPIFPPLAADFFYQMTDPHTNALIGTRNTPAEIPAGGSQSFVLQLTPTAPTPAVDVAFAFQCANSGSAPFVVGVNTLLLSASATPVPDIVALAATISGDGIVTTVADVGVFAVATSNVGAGASITVSTDTGLATGLPIVVSLCQSDPVTAACINPTVPSLFVDTTIGAGGTPTFSVFVQAFGPVQFDPGVNRIFVRFVDGNGITRGATSVAVRTQ